MLQPQLACLNTPTYENKKGRGVSPLQQVIGNPNRKAVLRPCQALLVEHKNKQDITETDNRYTNFKPSRKRFPRLPTGIKSCLPFMSLCPSAKPNYSLANLA